MGAFPCSAWLRATKLRAPSSPPDRLRRGGLQARSGVRIGTLVGSRLALVPTSAPACFPTQLISTLADMRRAAAVRGLPWVPGILLAALLAVGCGSGGGSSALQGVVRTPQLNVASAVLPNAADGDRPVAMKAPSSELYVVYFGYTSCPDICPTTLSDIRVALSDMPDELAARVTVAMATVDPERDTEAVLTGYLGHFFDHSLALRTTDPAALTSVTDAFGVQWQVADHASGEAYDVAHTAITYVVNDEGIVVVEWPFGLDAAAMTSDLTTLLREEQPT